jgi:hypothetical protein
MINCYLDHSVGRQELGGIELRKELPILSHSQMNVAAGREVVMKAYRKSPAIGLVLVLGMYIFGLSAGFAEEKGAIVGWEKDSAYNKLYNLDEWDSFKGNVVGFKQITPLKGMSPGVALLVQDGDSDEVVSVHLGPSPFVNPNSISFRKGDKVKVRGVWAEIDGKEVFMASKVKKGDYYEYKVRTTKDGTPFWTMSPEELARERAGK